jgi:hypothetical protein
MKNKKIYLFLAIILALILIALAVYFITTKNKKVCTPYADIATAVKTGDAKSCDCFRSDSLKKQCQTDISDATSYTSAVNRGDLVACEKILNEGMKEACVNIAQSKIDFINKK